MLIRNSSSKTLITYFLKSVLHCFVGHIVGFEAVVNISSFRVVL